jgi:hypothetical protein
MPRSSRSAVFPRVRPSLAGFGNRLASAKFLSRSWPLLSLRRGVISALCLSVALNAQAPPAAASAAGNDQSPDNGIHVGQPKVFDSRQLTLMLDSLSQALAGKQFVDPKQLSQALGNVQGFQSTDTSLSFQANGAVGPMASTVFGSPAAPSSTTTADSSGSTAVPSSPVTINITPSSDGSATTSASTTGSSLGPQPPALPTLQTVPTYNPTFGSNGSDLLSDEVNLTYQLYNVQMLLNRSLTDRLYDGKSRLQAVVGFDIDLVPDKYAQNAAAVVEVSVSMDSPPATCSTTDAPGMVALMPEEGSHNAANLSQKANAFGGALAASVFSVGVSAQKRSQIFYLYRDMDTISFERMTKDGALATFGWQFRPVLGRKSVDPGIRHMIAVLSLPCPDEENIAPKLNIGVNTSWRRYEDSTQTTTSSSHFWQHALPSSVPTTFAHLSVPATASGQLSLSPNIKSIQWIPSSDGTGIAVVRGQNFFLGTTVRLGSKLYSGAGDGLVIKSDQELEVPVPLPLVTVGGVLSGRYGAAVPLESPIPVDEGCALSLKRIQKFPVGTDVVQVATDLNVQDSAKCAEGLALSTLQKMPNSPVALVNGVPISSRPFVTSASDPIQFSTMIPADVAKKMTSFGISFPFAGRAWASTLPNAETTVRVTRVSDPVNTTLFIRSTNAAKSLCSGWTAELNYNTIIPKALPGARPVPGPAAPAAKTPAGKPQVGKPPEDKGSARCADSGSATVGKTLELDVPTKLLKGITHVLLVKAGEEPLVADIPKPDPPPPAPSLDKDQKISVVQNDVKPVTFKGKHLDQVTKVLFDKTQLTIVSQEDKAIVVSLSAELTAKPRSSVQLQMLSDGNDPILADLFVTAAKSPVKKGK